MIGASAAPRPRNLLVETVGFATVQDLGRPGLAVLGVPRSGAADRASAARAGRLVGNRPEAAVLEVVLGGLRLRARGELVLAVSGADVPVLLDGRAGARDTVLHLRPGAVVELGPARAGLRAYVAVRGGIDVPPVLGSRSRDTLAGLGPAPVRPGDVLPVGTQVERLPCVEHVPIIGMPEPGGSVVVRAVVGPRADHLHPASADLLWDRDRSVSADSDRIGVRLDGDSLRCRSGAAELPSEPLVRGSVQVPPDGRPVVFLADHPVTGGYPVVAVVLDADVDLIAQVRPGDRVRMRRVVLPGRGPVRPDLTSSWWGW